MYKLHSHEDFRPTGDPSPVDSVLFQQPVEVSSVFTISRAASDDAIAARYPAEVVESVRAKIEEDVARCAVQSQVAATTAMIEDPLLLLPVAGKAVGTDEEEYIPLAPKYVARITGKPLPEVETERYVPDFSDEDDTVAQTPQEILVAAAHAEAARVAEEQYVERQVIAKRAVYEQVASVLHQVEGPLPKVELDRRESAFLVEAARHNLVEALRSGNRPAVVDANKVYQLTCAHIGAQHHRTGLFARRALAYAMVGLQSFRF
jgi:hypothetical protein